MGGGLMQLIAYGNLDNELTGNPEITFIKSIYKRHTNFSSLSLLFSDFGSDTFLGSIIYYIYIFLINKILKIIKLII